MTTTVPDWLSRHGCDLRAGLNGQRWLVILGGSPQYILAVLPAKGGFSCGVSQSVNGKRVDSGKVWPTPEAALECGLEDLRANLGW